MKSPSHTYAFIDAANLMYGGKKSLGWSIDHKKLLKYLKEKYQLTKAYYYAGVDLCGMEFDPVEEDHIDLQKLFEHINNSRIPEQDKQKHLQSIKFYLKLKEFGYHLCLKPVKIFKDGNRITKKANCDVDMTFDLMRYVDDYDKALVLSGDGDFFAVLKYLARHKKKEIRIMSRAGRTAREIRRLAGPRFIDFVRLQKALEFIPSDKKRADIRNIRSTSVGDIITKAESKVKKGKK